MVSDRSRGVRALFLSAIMVLSVVGAGVAFAGSAAAADDSVQQITIDKSDSSNPNSIMDAFLPVTDEFGETASITRKYDSEKDVATFKISNLQGDYGAILFDNNSDGIADFQLGYKLDETNPQATVWVNIDGEWKEDTAFRELGSSGEFGSNPLTSDRKGTMPDAFSGAIQSDSLTVSLQESNLGGSFKFGIKDNSGDNYNFKVANTGWDNNATNDSVTGPTVPVRPVDKNGIVAVAPGTYEETIQLVTDNVTLTSTAGADETTIQASGETAIVASGNNQTISGFTIADSTEDDADAGIDTRGTDDLTIKNNTFEGTFRGTRHQVHGVDENLTIKNNVFNIDYGVTQTEDIPGLTVQGNTFDTATEGIGLGDGVEVEAIENNQFEGSGVHVKDYRGSPNFTQLDNIYDRNQFDTAVGVTNDGWKIPTIFAEIQPAVDSAESSDTIEIGAGTYSESIEITTSNLTLAGHGGPVIDGRVDIRSDLTTIQDLTIKHGAANGNEVEAIFVENTDSDYANKDGNIVISNVTIEDVHPHGKSKTVEGIHVKYYDQNTNPSGPEGQGPIDGVEISDVTIQNVTGPNPAGADGIKLQAGVENVTIKDTSISDVRGNWSYGIVTTPSGNEDGVPQSVRVYNSTIKNVSAWEYSGVGIGVDGSDDDGYADPKELYVEGNTFLENKYDLLNKNDSAVLDGTLNWFGETEANGSDMVNAMYDPFLSEPPAELDAETQQELYETTSYAHDIVVPADGDVHSVAFPAPVEESVHEVFTIPNGDVFKFEDGTWTRIKNIDDEGIDALDAFMVKNDGDEDVRLSFEYNTSSEPAPTMTSAHLEPGWNFVGAPQQDSSTDAFSSSTASVSKVFRPAKSAHSLPWGLYGTDDTRVNPEVVSPFQGYWVFANEDGTLGATLPVDPTYETEYPSLNRTAAE